MSIFNMIASIAGGGGGGEVKSSEFYNDTSGWNFVATFSVDEEPSKWFCVWTADSGTADSYQYTYQYSMYEYLDSDDNIVFFDGTVSSKGKVSAYKPSTSGSSYSTSYSNGTFTITSSSTPFIPYKYYTLYYVTGGSGSGGGGSSVSVEELNVTTNGTYTAPAGTAYSPVNVTVSSSSKNVQTNQTTSRTSSTSLTSVNSLTCSTAGTYDVYWTCDRSSTSGTWSSQLYLGGTAYGSEQTTWSNHVQTVHLSNVSISANQTVAVYVKARGTNYYGYAPQLTIVQS